MKFEKTIHAIDSHTMGEPTRIVVGGIPVIQGKTMIEKKEYLERKMDYLRTSMILEPRGHNNMFGAVLTGSTLEEADFGIIFMDSGGYLNMCGHGSIAAATIAVEVGLVEVKEPYTNIILEAPAGLIKAKIKVENGSAVETSIENVPSFLYKEDLQIEIPKIGKVFVDIAFGGSFFAIVKAADLGIDIKPQNSYKISEIGLKIRKIINETIEIKHPLLPHIKTVDLVEMYGPAKSTNATLQNVVVFGDGQIDRSPCGTGTSAKMATLFSKGQLKIGEEFIYESIIGTTFKGKVIKETNIGNFKGIVPEITASAYITGFNNFVIDDNDPIKFGFKLS